MKTNIGLPSKTREHTVDLLSRLLADEHVLYIKTRNFHWNVTGPHFSALHALFEEHYTALAGTIDDIAERIRALGAYAPGSMKEFSKLARLKEAPGGSLADTRMLTALLADHESIIRQLRADITVTGDKLGDEATTDFLTGLLAAHEKTAWMLRATLS
ncbi:MAG: DNA starvation/stationary phase protection protein [Verrucomicrobiota bacterium]